jgi:hypothetical protein
MACVTGSPDPVPGGISTRFVRPTLALESGGRARLRARCVIATPPRYRSGENDPGSPAWRIPRRRNDLHRQAGQVRGRHSRTSGASGGRPSASDQGGPLQPSRRAAGKRRQRPGVLMRASACWALFCPRQPHRSTRQQERSQLGLRKLKRTQEVLNRHARVTSLERHTRTTVPTHIRRSNPYRAFQLWREVGAPLGQRKSIRE